MFPARFLAFLILLGLAGGWVTGCGETEESSETPLGLPSNNDLTLQLVTSSLTFPVFMTAAPGDSTRLFIVEKGGRIRLLTVATGSLATFLDMTGQISTDGEERGLLGMAFDPNFGSNRRFYVFYTDTSGSLVIARFQRSAGNPNVADSAPAAILQTIDHPTFSNHNGGMLAFGSDGCLYAGTGDGGGSGDPNNNAQRLSTKLGKMLRLDPSTGGACVNGGVNPFVLLGGLPEIWSRGLRNPWRFSFDRETNDLYIGDVGENAREEVNVSPAPNAGRQSNYGWRLMEGSVCFNPTTNCDTGGLTSPVLDYPHTNGACSITGGYVYRGSDAPALRGMYFYADYCDGSVRSFRFLNGQTTSQSQWPLLSRSGITSFGEDAQGELYLMTQGGSLYKIVPN